MSDSKKCCATCKYLKFWNTPYPHYWCPQNKDCPCDYDETPDYDFACDKYSGGDEVKQHDRLD